jgi:glycosyltransferase involved in cell wall biosynthesis
LALPTNLLELTKVPSHESSTQPTENASEGTVLIVAFHFPPQSGSSGLLRSLKYCRYLPEFGWRPVVLTLRPGAYESLDPRGHESVPKDVTVVRAFALDAKKYLSFRGAYFEWTAIPDRWASWVLGAVPAGLRAIRNQRVDIIFSTFPISSAVLIGWLLHLFTGKPWVADFRDSMTEEHYPREKLRRMVWRWIESKAVGCASRLVFTAASTRKAYLERYPNLSPEKCLLISNGYDEEDFSSLNIRESSLANVAGPLKLLHTGLIYPEERDPRPFFRALARLRREGQVSSDSLNIVFRASGSEDLYQKIIDELRISDLVQLRPHVPYRQALQECADADGLLLFQAANCDHQIPAKAYEYLRLGKPIFALTSRSGDTAALLEEVGGATIVNLAEENDIHGALPGFLSALRAGTHPLANRQKARCYERRNQAGDLAKCLSQLKAETSAPTSEKEQSFAR